MWKDFNNVSTEGTFLQEILQTSIVTLPKPGKGHVKPANLKLISLLKSDVKFFAKVIKLN